MNKRDAAAQTLREVFDPHLLRLGAARVATPAPSEGLLYRMRGEDYLRVDFDYREGELLLYVGRGEGRPPAWDVEAQDLLEFPLDMVLEELGGAAVDDSPLRQPGVEADPLRLVASRYADAIVALGARLRLTQDLIDVLRRRAVAYAASVREEDT